MTTDKMIHQVFISTGALNAMFTLRVARMINGLYIERYVKNLSTDFDKADRLAREYADTLNERIGGKNCVVFYNGADVDWLFERRGKLSVRDTIAIEEIENGIVPFGKHKGQKINDLPDSYVLWLTDRLKDENLSPVFYALAISASNIAIERDLISKRDQARQEKYEKDVKSTFFGEPKTRYEHEVFVESKFENRYDDGEFSHYSYVLKIDDHILTYKGNIDLPLGEKVLLKFTVKHHYGDDIQRTYINRPKVV